MLALVAYCGICFLRWCFGHTDTPIPTWNLYDHMNGR
jgi:hypothetical protein